MRLDSGVALPGEEKGQEHLTSMFAPGILYQQGVEGRERATVANRSEERRVGKECRL